MSQKSGSLFDMQFITSCISTMLVLLLKIISKNDLQQGKKVRLLLAEVVDNLIWHRFRVASIYDIIEPLLLFERK